MRIQVRDGLAFVSATITFRQRVIALGDVLLDTGSTGTVFAIDRFDASILFPEPEDAIHQISGIGGSEYVFSKKVESLALGEIQVQDFPVEFGAMRYGVPLDGIIGLDFLLDTGSVIDLGQLEVYRGDSR